MNRHPNPRREFPASEAHQVIQFPRVAPASFRTSPGEFPRPLGAATPPSSPATLDAELRELRSDVAGARLVLEAASRGDVSPRAAIACALIRLGT